MDNKKKAVFNYESANKAEGVKHYEVTVLWWLRGCVLRMFQGESNGENKRFHICDIKGNVTLSE